MKIKMGQPKRLVKKAQKDGTGRLKLKEGDNFVRVLFGPVLVNTVFYPSLDRSEEGEIKAITKSARVPDRGSVFHALSAVERKLLRAHGVEKPRSTFDSKSKWNYLVINLEDDDYEVQILQAPKTVFEELVELETKRDREDPTKLAHGLIWMWNAVITKKIDPSKSPQFGTEYSVAVDTKNKWTGLVPAEWLDAEFDELTDGTDPVIDLGDVFSDAMLKGMEDTEIDLEADGTPEDEAAILERLSSFPVNLDATDRRSEAPIFKHPEELLNILGEAGLLNDVPFITESGKPPQLTIGTSRPIKQKENEDGTVDADFEEASSAVEVETEEEEEEEEAPLVKAKLKPGAGKGKLKSLLQKAEESVADDEDDD